MDANHGQGREGGGKRQSTLPPFTASEIGCVSKHYRNNEIYLNVWLSMEIYKSQCETAKLKNIFEFA